MDENVKLFRTAVRGFNKDDVVDYIEKMNFNFKSELDTSSKALKEIEGKLAEAQLKNEEYKRAAEENEALKAELERLKEELASAEEAKKELQAKLSESEELAAAQNDALDQLCKENEELKASSASVQTNNDPEIEEKAKLYDKMSSKIGAVIIDANRNADSVISSAKDEGNAIIENAAVIIKVRLSMLFCVTEHNFDFFFCI